jgi:thymidylate synthase (FAD)
MTTYEQSPTIPVLNHGLVRLVDHMGDDLSIVRAARVSYDAAWRTGTDQGSDERLINYLWKNGHTSPFEMVNFTFEIKAPIFVFRQWHRHRVWKFNELSARYRELPEVFYVPDEAVIGKQSSSSKQARDTDVEQEHSADIAQIIGAASRASFSEYHKLLAMGAPRELARSVLPLGTYSHMFASIDLHNLLKFLNLRMHPHAQYEIRVYAEAMLELIRSKVPVAVAAWEKSRS